MDQLDRLTPYDIQYTACKEYKTLVNGPYNICLGSSNSRWSTAQVGSKEELVQSNIELKVKCESLKYDVREKTELLAKVKWTHYA